MADSGILIVKEGQIFTGRKKLSAESGIPESTIEDILNYFETQHQIQQQKTTKYRLITIVNWKDYQNVQQQSNNKATTKQHIQEAKEIKETSEQGSQEEYSIEELDDNGDPLPLKKKKDISYRRVFGLWGEKYPLNWNVNRTEIAAAQNILKEHGIEKAKLAIEFYKENNHEPHCPQILKPSDLDRKWVNLQTMRDKMYG